MNGSAWVSVNKAPVTQASSAIPVVPLYIGILYKIKEEKGTHEGCIEQITRLFNDHIGPGDANPDDAGRIRIDDWEMAEDVQAAVKTIWDEINTDNLNELSDYQGYQDDFLKLFGFGRADVDHDAPTEVAPHTGLIFSRKKTKRVMQKASGPFLFGTTKDSKSNLKALVPKKHSKRTSYLLDLRANQQPEIA